MTLPGWIPREELLRLYERAHAFVYPSTFEGFGMPVLEAMAAGIPVACSDIPPLREVAGERRAVFRSAGRRRDRGRAGPHRDGCRAAAKTRRGGTWARKTVHLGSDGEKTLQALQSGAALCNRLPWSSIAGVGWN